MYIYYIGLQKLLKLWPCWQNIFPISVIPHPLILPRAETCIFLCSFYYSIIMPTWVKILNDLPFPLLSGLLECYQIPNYPEWVNGRRSSRLSLQKSSGDMPWHKCGEWNLNYSIRVPGWVLKCLNLITAPGSVSNQPGSVTWLATAGISKIHAVSWRNHIENQTTKGAQNM